MRIFIALNLPREVRQKIGSISRELQAASEQGRFVREELLHMTLEFMGSLEEEGLQRLIRVLDWLTFEPFTIRLGEPGYFPGRKGRTWWIGVEESPELTELQAELHRLLKEADFSLEERVFHPHITLGRDVRVKPDRAFFDRKDKGMQFEASEIHVMQSDSSGGRLSYTSRHRIAAGNKGAGPDD